jgi:hypothetical protein
MPQAPGQAAGRNPERPGSREDTLLVHQIVMSAIQCARVPLIHGTLARPVTRRGVRWQTVDTRGGEARSNSGPDQAKHLEAAAGIEPASRVLQSATCGVTASGSVSHSPADLRFRGRCPDTRHVESGAVRPGSFASRLQPTHRSEVETLVVLVDQAGQRTTEGLAPGSALSLVDGGCD